MWLATGVLFGACGEPPAVLSEQSLPGAVVELSVDELVEPTELDLVERLRYGLDKAGHYVFAYVGDVEVAANGEIFVLDNGTAEVVHLDTAGNLLGIIGGRGKGPGEFVNPYYLALSDDTVFVLDRSYLHAFSFDGDALYSRRRVWVQPTSGVTPLHDIAWAGANLVGIRRTMVPFDLVDGGTFLDSIIVQRQSTTTGQFDGPALRLEGRSYHRRGSFYGKTLFGGVGSVDVTAEGEIIYAQGQDYRLDVYDTNGILLKHVVATVPRKKVDAAMKRDLIQRGLAAEESLSSGHPIPSASDLRSIPNTPWRATLNRLIAGDDGLVLVERMDVTAKHPVWPERESIWDLIDLGGGVRGRITLPAGFKPMAFREHSLYGAELTGLIPTVVRYDIVEAEEAI